MMFKRMQEEYVFLIEREYIDRVGFSKSVIREMLSAEKFKYKNLGDGTLRVAYTRHYEPYITHKEVEAKLTDILDRIELIADTYDAMVKK